MKWLDAFEAKRLAQDRRAEDGPRWSSIFLARTKIEPTRVFILEWSNLDHGIWVFYDPDRPSGANASCIGRIHAGLEISSIPVKVVDSFQEARRIAQDFEALGVPWERTIYVYWQDDSIIRAFLSDPYYPMTWIDPTRRTIRFRNNEKIETMNDYACMTVKCIVTPYLR